MVNEDNPAVLETTTLHNGDTDNDSVLGDASDDGPVDDGGVKQP